MKPEQLSRTAAFIAIKFYGLTRMEPYRSWFDPDVVLFYERLVRSLPAPLNRFYSLLQKKWVRTLSISFEELLLPGDLLHILMRKYYIRRRIDDLLAGGYEQLVVPGSGFDHLAVWYSLREIPTYEIDAPRMARLKQDFVRENGYANPSLSVIPTHFTSRPLLQTLEEIPRLDASRKTVIVAEGLFDYLAPEEMREMVTGLTRFFGDNVALISTIFALDELPVLRRWVFRAGVAAAGEKLRLYLSSHAMQQSFEDSGFTIESVMDSASMKRGLPGREMLSLAALEGFYLVICQKK